LNSDDSLAAVGVAENGSSKAMHRASAYRERDAAERT
jgi:hypothetical protein